MVRTVQVQVLLPILGKNKIENRRFVKLNKNGFILGSDNNILDIYAGISVLYRITVSCI